MLHLAIGIVILLGTLLITRTWFREADEQLFLWIHGIVGDLGDGPLVYLTELGSLYAMVALGIALWVTGRRRLGGPVLIALATSSIIGYAWKMAIARPRPYEVFPQVLDLNEILIQSFPSGHSLVTFTVAGVMMVRCPRYANLMLVFAGLIAVSRVLIGAHFPFDVIAGAALGLLIGKGVGGTGLWSEDRPVDGK